LIRVTADTNIYISGLNFRGGHPFRFLELARTGKILLAVSDAILDEIAEVLQRKFDWPAGDIAESRELISSFAQRVAPTETFDAVRDDPDDNRILECAAAARVDYVVSGDNHLLNLRTFRDIPIVKVADFMEIFEQDEGRDP
jgi:putative PIN family toxin of toxin-antitoxin system